MAFEPFVLRSPAKLAANGHGVLQSRSSRWMRTPENHTHGSHTVAVMVMVLGMAAPESQGQGTIWIEQFGSNGREQPTCMVHAPHGGFYIAGYTDDDLGGVSAGGHDAWLARYDKAGERVWIRQLGTSAADFAFAVARDDSSGVFVAGHTNGSLGGPSNGNSDVWLAHFDASGNQTWLRQFGTADSDDLAALSIDGAGGVFLSGSTTGDLDGANAGEWDGWLARHDAAGDQTWIRQFGTPATDQVFAAATDGTGGVYLTGASTGHFGGLNAGESDAWIARHDAEGDQLWIDQFGTSSGEVSRTAYPDGAGGVYIAGNTNGGLDGFNNGSSDAWLARYTASGNQGWLRQFGTAGGDDLLAVTVDSSGTPVIAGRTIGDFGGKNAGGWDPWVARIHVTGDMIWIRQLGTDANDQVNAACPDGNDGIFVAGHTVGSLGGPNAGDSDVWVANYAGETARVRNVVVQTGTLLDGTVDAIRATDNARLKVRSRFVEGGNPPYIALVDIKLKSRVDDPTSLNLLIESSINQNPGTAKVFAYYWQVAEWQRVSTRVINELETAVWVDDLDAQKYVRADGIIRLRIRHEMVTSSNGLPFISRIDYVEARLR